MKVPVKGRGFNPALPGPVNCWEMATLPESLYPESNGFIPFS
jgi:hypothetical protein